MGHKVVAMDDLSGGFMENVPKKCTFVKGRVENRALVAKALQKRTSSITSSTSPPMPPGGLSHFIPGFQLQQQPHRQHPASSTPP